MARIIYDGQLVNLCLLSKDLLNFEPPYRKCWLCHCDVLYQGIYIRIYIYIYKNNLKIMILKKGVGIDHCYKKVRKQGGKHALASIAIKSKETRWKNALDRIGQSI